MKVLSRTEEKEKKNAGLLSLHFPFFVCCWQLACTFSELLKNSYAFPSNHTKIRQRDIDASKGSNLAFCCCLKRHRAAVKSSRRRWENSSRTFGKSDGRRKVDLETKKPSCFGSMCNLLYTYVACTAADRTSFTHALSFEPQVTGLGLSRSRAKGAFHLLLQLQPSYKVSLEKSR